MARLTAGQPLGEDPGTDMAPVDSNKTDSLGPAGMTVTIGFGPGLFEKGGARAWSWTQG